MLRSGLAAGALNGFGVIAAFAADRYEGNAAIALSQEIKNEMDVNWIGFAEANP